MNSGPTLWLAWLRDLASLRLKFFIYNIGLVLTPKLLGCRKDLIEIMLRIYLAQDLVHKKTLDKVHYVLIMIITITMTMVITNTPMQVKENNNGNKITGVQMQGKKLAFMVRTFIEGIREGGLTLHNSWSYLTCHIYFHLKTVKSKLNVTILA